MIISQSNTSNSTIANESNDQDKRRQMTSTSSTGSFIRPLYRFVSLRFELQLLQSSKAQLNVRHQPETLTQTKTILSLIWHTYLKLQESLEMTSIQYLFNSRCCIFHKCLYFINHPLENIRIVF